MSTPTGSKQQKLAKSGGKDPTRSDTISQQQNTFQILLQSRSSSLQCYPDKISMTSKDMKLLNVKAGSSVLLECDGAEIICKAWASKTLAAGTATIHRIWWPNFPVTGRRMYKISSDLSSFRVKKSKYLFLSIMCIDNKNTENTMEDQIELNNLTGDDLPGFASSAIFMSYAMCSLQDLPLAVGHQMGVSWKSRSVILRVEKSSDNVHGEDCGLKISTPKLRFLVDCNTVLKFVKSNRISSVCSAENVHGSSPRHDNEDSRSHTTKRASDMTTVTSEGSDAGVRELMRKAVRGEALPGFGGYHVEVRDALAVTLLGLGLIGRNHFNDYGKGVHEDQKGRESVEDNDKDRRHDGERGERGKTAHRSTGEDIETSSTAHNDNSTFHPERGSEIRDLESLSLQQSFSRELFRPPKGILLHGPSGTGKSCLMKSLAESISRNSDVRVLSISHDILLSRYVGEGENKLREIFSTASRLSPCIILMDDIDLLCADRAGKKDSNQSTSSEQKQLVSCLLTLVDGVQADNRSGSGRSGGGDGSAVQGTGGGVFIMATSSKPNNIDPAMRRPGRLDKEIELNVPSGKDRELILLSILRNMGIAVQNNEANENVLKNVLSFVPNPDEVANLGSEFLKLQLQSCRQEKNNANFGSLESDSVECAVMESDQITLPDKMRSSTSSLTLTTSFIKHIADTAHGMVACDLLQVAKEASFLSLDRYTSELKRIKEKKCDTYTSSDCENVRDVEISLESGPRSVLESSLGSITETRPRSVPFSKMESDPGSTLESGLLVSRLNVEKEICTDGKSDDLKLVRGVTKTPEPEHSGSGEDGGIYRPMNLISDYDDEEDEGSEGQDGDQDEDDGVEQEEKDEEEAAMLDSSDHMAAAIKEIRIGNDKAESSQTMPTDFGSKKDGYDGPKLDAKSDIESTPLLVLLQQDFQLALTRISPSALREVAIEVPSVFWSDIGGMDGVKQSLREVVELPYTHPHLFESLNISPPKGILLYGPPGCSKTLMAKALATESGLNFLAVRGPELLSKWLGESEKAIQTLFRRARAAAPSLIFFDEIDALAGKRGDSSAGVNDRVLSQLLTELDGAQSLSRYGQSKRVVVVAATNRPDILDPALIRPGRIDRKIYVPPPDEESRSQILSIELKRMPTTFTVPPYKRTVKKAITGNRDFDWHTANPVLNAGDLSDKLEKFSFSPSGVGRVGADVDSAAAEGDEIARERAMEREGEKEREREDALEGEELLSTLLEMTQGFSGAEVVACVQEAGMLAIDQGHDVLYTSHLFSAIRGITPQITKEVLSFYEKIAASY